MRPRTLLAIVLVVVLAAATTLHRLGAGDVCGSNEAVEAVFLQQMVEHDALLFPLENGKSPMYKPPLFHWTAVAIDRLSGIKAVTAFNLRLPSALYAIAGVILTLAFALSFLGVADAILAGLILTASYQYLENARIGRVDMTLCFFETLALFAFMWWFAPRARTPSSTAVAPGDPQSGSDLRHPTDAPLPSTSSVASTASELRGPDALRYLLAIALGLAVLGKGPVGALLPGLAILVFLILARRLRDLWRLATPGTVIVTVAIASSWYLACLFGRRYGFLNRQIGSENFGRFFGSLGAMAPWYYLKPVLLNSAPLSLLVPFAVAAALRTWWRSIDSAKPLAASPMPDASAQSETESANRVDLAEASAKEPDYASASRPDEARSAAPSGIRPSQNPLSLWMSLRMMFLPPMDQLTDERPQSAAASWRATIAVRLFAIFWVVTVLFFSVAAYKRRAYLLPLWPASAVILAWWMSTLARSRWGRTLRSAVVATALVLIFVNFFYLPRREVRECAGDSMREAAAQINRVVGPGEPLYLFQFEDEPAPLLFYLNRTAPRIWGKLGDAPPGYVIITAAAWAHLKDQALDLEPVLESSSGRPRLVLLRRGKALASR